MGLDQEWAENGFFVLKRVAKTSGADGSGYVDLEFYGHTYGREPQEWLNERYGDEAKALHGKTLIFFKISECVRVIPDFKFIPEQTEVRNLEIKDGPITDIRWME